MTARYCVFGNPVAHSLSPGIHRLFAVQTGQNLTYEAIRVELGQFPAALRAFQMQGGQGANVTVPFKADAFRVADTRSGRAELAGAVNTLRLEADGRWYGDNTDGIGLVRDLTGNLELALNGCRVLLIGAGGSASGVVGPLLSAGVANIVIANRTPARAAALAERHGSRVQACSLADPPERPSDLLINATSGGLRGEAVALPAYVLTAQTLCYDLSYGAAAEAFLRWCRGHGAVRVSDGLGMLVEQAAESFLVWRGVRPDVAPILAQLRAVNRAPH